VATFGRANRFGHVPDYFKRANGEICVIVQIETPEAVARVKEIGSVEGVDALFVGPYDLATSMGHLANPSHPEVIAAIDKVLAAAKAIGKPVGTVSQGPGDARKRFDMGYRFVSVGSEISTMVRACEEQLAAARRK
jgi:2-keto-3-deoxy-L-rhamnonate aldolase RhmA